MNDGVALELGFPEKSLFQFATNLASVLFASFAPDALRKIKELVIEGSDRLRAENVLDSRLDETRHNLDTLVRRTLLTARSRESTEGSKFEIDAEVAARGGGAQGADSRATSGVTVLRLSDLVDALKELCPLFPFC